MRKFKSWGTTRQTLTVAGALLALLIVVGALAGGSSDTKTTADKPAATTTTTAAAPATTAKPKPAPAVKRTTASAPAVKAKPAPKPNPAPATKPKPSGDPAVDRNTRAYAQAVNGCREFAAIVRAEAAKATDMLDMADLTTTARDGCDNRRSAMLGMDTKHFDDQAAQAWAGVDKLKSGLNALLAYIDNPRPSKIIEARDKLNEGDATARAGLRGINQRRHAYGLHALKVG